MVRALQKVTEHYNPTFRHSNFKFNTTDLTLSPTSTDSFSMESQALERHTLARCWPIWRTLTSSTRTFWGISVLYACFVLPIAHTAQFSENILFYISTSNVFGWLVRLHVLTRTLEKRRIRSTLSPLSCPRSFNAHVSVYIGTHF